MADDKTQASQQPQESATPAASEGFSPEELREVAQEISSLYPPPRLGTELVMLEVNPHRAHAYWNIDVEDYQRAAAQCGTDAPPLLLRIHDVTGIEFDGNNAHSYFDLQVQGLQGHWYVDLWKDGRSYVAELGLRRPNGGLVQLARSNPVATPPASESPHYENLPIDVTQPHLPLQPSAVEASDPSLDPGNLDVETGAPIDLNPPPIQNVPRVEDASFEAPDTLPSSGDPAPAALQPSLPVEEVRLREFPLPPPFAIREDALREEVHELFRETERVASSTAAQPMPKQDTSPLPSRTEPMEEAASEPRADWPSAEELSRHVPDTSGAAPQDLAMQPGVGSPPDGGSSAAPSESAPSAAAEAPAAPAPPPVAKPLEQYISLSSFEKGRAQVALEVNVELHIYGRAKPGLQLSLYGQPVHVQPDGTFSIRKPLPQGAVVLPLLAVEPPVPPAEG